MLGTALIEGAISESLCGNTLSNRPRAIGITFQCNWAKHLLLQEQLTETLMTEPFSSFKLLPHMDPLSDRTNPHGSVT